LDNPAPAAPAVPAPAPAEPMTEPANDAGFGDFGGEEMPAEDPMGDAPAEDPSSDMSFEKEPFDAGIEADEETDPKKFIEQLSGKLGQSLRQFAKDNGQPDFELEKFAINSVISATHTAQMDEEDKNDIIKKINKSGEDETQDFDNNNQDSADDGDDSFGGDDNGGGNADEFDFSSDEEPVQEDSFKIYEREDLFLENPKMNNMFQPGSNDILDEMNSCWKGYKQVGMKEKNGKEVPNCVRVNENIGESNNYMFWQNLKTLVHAASELLNMDKNSLDALLSDGHGWALDHIATSADDVEEVYHFAEGALNDRHEDSGEEMDYSKWTQPMKLNKPIEVSKDLAYHLTNEIALGESIFRYGSEKFQSLLKEVKTLNEKGLISLNENDQFIVEDYDNGFVMVNEGKVKLNTIFEDFEIETINEAEYQGKKVELGKPKRGGSKKFFVYVRNPKTGKVKKVSFGAKAGGGNLAVKLKDPKARKAFADRHNCKSKNDKTKPGYWACRLPRYAKLLGLSGGGTWW
jgi:hypothetical protein